MDPFESILKILGRDYRSLSDNELKKLVRKYNLDDFNTTIRDSSFTMSSYDMPSRKKIIEQLEARDRFANSFFAMIISVVAVIISVVAVVVSIGVAILK